MANLQNTTVQGSVTLPNDIDIAGRLSKPNLPMIDASKSNGGGCYSTTGPVPFNSISVNNGGFSITNSNSRFTVPEDGIYWVGFWTIGHNNCGSTGRVRLRVNGSNTSEARSDSSIRYGNCYAYRLFNLSEGDYIEANMSSSFIYFNATQYNRFVIFKVT